MRAQNTSVAELLEGSKVLAVPLFQRRYSWRRAQWRALWTNIREQYEYQAVEEQTGQQPVNHFIGSFVLNPVMGSASPPRILVVDGQQRLITISALLAAIRDLRWEKATQTHERNWLENDFTKTYLTNSTLNPNAGTRFRVLPTQEDRDDFSSIVGETPGSPAGSIGEAYRYFRKEARGTDYNDVPYDLDRLTNVILRRLSLVEILTEQGDNVHRVFQTLNSSGVMLKQVDLLRNHFFMLLPTHGDDLYRAVWRDMELRLGETAMDKFFWASLVPFDTRVARKTVFSTMQTRLAREGIEGSEERVETALRQLDRDSAEYLKLIEPTEEPRSAVSVRLEALSRWGTDTYYPLGLRLLTASREGAVSEADLGLAFLAIESFLVRRMLVGVPTNNLNRMFATLTGAVPSQGILEWLRDSLVSVGNIWPDDATVRASVAARPFFFSGQPGQRVFVLERINDWLSGETSGAPCERSSYELLHVMPAVKSESWPLEGGEPEREERERLVNTLGNAVLVHKGSQTQSGAALGDMQAVLADEGLPVNTDVIRAEAWTTDDISKRSVDLADAILQIWPGPTSSGAATREVSAITEDLALSMPDGAFTTVEDLAEYWSVSEGEVRNALPQWSAESLSRIRREVGGSVLAEVPHESGDRERLGRRLTAEDLARLTEEDDAQNLEQAEE